MVAEASDEGAAGECPERSARILAVLLGHEVLVEYAAIVLLALVLDDRLDLESAFRGVHKVGVHYDDVIDVAASLIKERAVSGLEHGQERGEEILAAYFADLFLSAHINGHAVVSRVVVHVSHGNDLDARILLHEFHGFVVHDLASPASERRALAADPGRKVGYEEREHLAAEHSADHEDVTGAEMVLVLLAHLEIDVAVEVERDGAALEHLEKLRPVEQGDIDSTTVRTIIVDDLEVGISDLRHGHEILEDMPVLDLADAEDCVIDLVVIFHGADYLCHVVELLVIFGVGPVVGSVGKELIIILALVMDSVEEVLKIVESDHIALLAAGNGHGHSQEQDDYDIYYLFHIQKFISLFPPPVVVLRILALDCGSLVSTDGFVEVDEELVAEHGLKLLDGHAHALVDLEAALA